MYPVSPCGNLATRLTLGGGSLPLKLEPSCRNGWLRTLESPLRGKFVEADEFCSQHAGGVIYQRTSHGYGLAKILDRHASYRSVRHLLATSGFHAHLHHALGNVLAPSKSLEPGPLDTSGPSELHLMTEMGHA